MPPAEINLYFTNTRAVGGQVPPFNQAVARLIPGGANPFSAALDQYFRGPSAEEQAQGLVALRNGFATYRRVEFNNGVLAVYLAGNCQSNGTAYSIAQPLMATLKQFPGVKYVKIFDEYDHTRDAFTPSNSWPVCLDLLFTSTWTPLPTLTSTLTFTPPPTRTITPVPSATSTATASPTNTAVPSATPIPFYTRTPTPAPTLTFTPLPTSTPRPTRTPLPTRTASSTPAPSATSVPSRTAAPTPLPSSTPTRTPVPSATMTPRPTLTFTASPSATLVPTRTSVPTAVPSLTPTRTPNPTATWTLIPSATATASATRTPRPTVPPTFTARPSNTPQVFATSTPAATSTPSASPTPFSTATSTLDLGCTQAEFLGDVTITDNAILHVGEAFTKTWRVKNAGTCTWTPAYKLVFVRGDPMAAPDFVPLPGIVGPNQTIDLPVNLTAPSLPGQYQGFWQLQTPDGRTFGMGPIAAGYLWVKVNVIGPALVTATSGAPLSPTAAAATATLQVQPASGPTLAMDFVADACAAQWQGNDGILECPGQDGDPRGFMLQRSQADMEDGNTLALPTLLTMPSSAKDGYVLGLYPQYVVQSGDRFQAAVGCEANAVSCSVLFRLSYLDSAGAAHDLWTLGEFYDGKYFTLDLDLGSLTGQQVRFVLSVNDLGSSVGDRALWVAPRVIHTQSGAAATLSTATSVPPTPSIIPPTVTPLLAATPTAQIIPTSTPAAPQPAPAMQRILDSIVSFFRQLFGIKN